MNNQTTSKEPFIMASIQERKYISTFQNEHPDFNVYSVTNVSGYAPFDCYVQSALTNNWAVEVKIRTFKMDKYDTAYIKCRKWYKMTQECNTSKYRDKNVQPIYMMFFTCGHVAIWNLFKCSAKYIEKQFKLWDCIEDSPIVTNKLFELNFKEAVIYKWK